MNDIIKMITLLLYRMKRVLAEEYCVLQVITSNNTYHIKIQLLDIENMKSTKYSNENRDSSHIICIGGSKWGKSGHGPIMVLGRGLPPPQAAEGIVDSWWIMEISRFFCSHRLKSKNVIYRVGIYLRYFRLRCKLMPKMHQNTFGGRVPPGPAGKA